MLRTLNDYITGFINRTSIETAGELWSQIFKKAVSLQKQGY